MIKSYKDLIAWQKARKLVLEIYILTQNFPDNEKYALTSQLRRASISVPSNIAEGRARNSRKDFAYFISISIGSLAEIDTQIILACDLKYISQSDYEKISLNIIELQKILYGLKKSLKAQS